MHDQSPEERRRHERSEFAYPVEFKITLPSGVETAFAGNIVDLSLGGAQMQCDDRYGRIELRDLKNVRIMVSLTLPEGEKIDLAASVRWMRRLGNKPFGLSMGIQFEEMEEQQRDSVERIITLKNKDKNMIWNLWEHYDEGVRR